MKEVKRREALDEDFSPWTREDVEVRREEEREREKRKKMNFPCFDVSCFPTSHNILGWSFRKKFPPSSSSGIWC